MEEALRILGSGLLFFAALYPLLLLVKLLMRLRIYVELLIAKEEDAAEARERGVDDGRG